MCGAERNEPIMLVMYNLKAVRQPLFYFKLSIAVLLKLVGVDKTA